MTAAKRFTSAALAAVMGAALPSGPTAHAQQHPRVPLQRGLTLTYASTYTNGEPDYETLIVIEALDSGNAQLRTSWNRGDRRWRNFRRPLSRRERERARAIYLYGSEKDTTHYRGYAIAMATGVILEELKRTGRADVAVLVPEISKRTPYRGALVRTGTAAEAFPVILDGRRVSLPGIRVKGVLQNLTASEPQLRMEFVFLDDPAAPWYLDSRIETPGGVGGRKLLVRIATNDAQQDLATALRTRCVAEVGDIHFASGSADVDSASAPAFRRIAAVLKENPDWQLTLVGHTDSIGSAAANLELSRRRTAAVREILIRDYRVNASRLMADGKGEVSPLEDNGSPAGRARNRRVELKRRCD